MRTPGFKSRIRPPYPQRVVKGDLRGAVIYSTNNGNCNKITIRYDTIPLLYDTIGYVTHSIRYDRIFHRIVSYAIVS